MGSALGFRGDSLWVVLDSAVAAGLTSATRD